MQANGSDQEIIATINITPLVDVSLVLVIIFMITMPFLVEKGMKIKSSQEKVVQVSSVSEPILVEISSRDIRVEGRLVGLSQISSVVGRLLKQRGVNAVAVSADPQRSHGEVVQVLDQVMESGAQDLNLLEPEGGAARSSHSRIPARNNRLRIAHGGTAKS
ncbi:MAG: biopolymer transporter ExbD [Elusimicrobia bacterium]|nr:biopolymer transporter ExbD [Elusimicrobiota bacterium]